MTDAEVALRRIENIMKALAAGHTGKLPKTWQAEIDVLWEAIKE